MLRAYEIVLNKRVIFLLGMGIILVFLSVLLWRFESKKKQERWKKMLVEKIGCFLALYCSSIAVILDKIP